MLLHAIHVLSSQLALSISKINRLGQPQISLEAGGDNIRHLPTVVTAASRLQYDPFDGLICLETTVMWHSLAIANLRVYLDTAL